MQTLAEKYHLLFLKLIANVTFQHAAEIPIRGKIAMVVELLKDIPNTPIGRVRKYIISNFRTGTPFVPEIALLLIENREQGGTDQLKIEILPESLYDEDTRGKETSAGIEDWKISVNPELNRKHCTLAESWLAELQEDGFGRSEDIA